MLIFNRSTIILLSLLLTLTGCSSDNNDGFIEIDPIYQIGDIGLGGGPVFYVNKNYQADGWRYMEASPADVTRSIVWSNIVANTVGPTGTAIGSGKANTAAIIAQTDGATVVTDGAALLCSDLTAGGFDDWFLPSIGEANQMYELWFQESGATQPVYWSSSELTDTTVWITSCITCMSPQPNISFDQYIYDKAGNNSVRCVRQFNDSDLGY